MDKENAKYTLRPNNKTAVYECNDGYLASTNAAIEVFCTSLDEDTEPYKWSTPSFTCEKGTALYITH